MSDTGPVWIGARSRDQGDGEIGWILDDNQGMRAIAETIESAINRAYVIYEKTL